MSFISSTLFAFSTTIGGALIGAMSSSWLSESYKRYRDTKAMAFALAGELGALLEFVSDELLKSYTDLAACARAGKADTYSYFDYQDVVYQKCIEKMGILDGDIPLRLVSVYTKIAVWRHNADMAQMFFEKGKYPQAAQAMEFLALSWPSIIRPDASQLVSDLKHIGQKSWFRTIFPKKTE